MSKKTGLPEMTNGKVTFTPLEKNYTEKEVIKFLKTQIEECAKSIDTDNMSVYTARRKIYATKVVNLK